MTLSDVMALDGRKLNQAVAMKVSPVKYVQEWLYFEPAESDGVIYNGPDFSRDWSAAMQIRDWARGLPRSLCQEFVYRLIQCVEERVKKVGWTANAYDVLLLAECPDYARAALLVRE